ncbi:MAG: hypothetical protein P0Y49_14160 [Candidatus Pedobacter colombiensis]|uniref:Uncharacterized protein n=1 Tax=Candidatus Pedobacter colombiensis TaxID=3121371 RepID=A0AAJ6B4R4_9SPHI|nr:hypothetical protein [Pedobacter sp.]WEK17942.1 MAG: hypothetical protein P0Y49_14160 [Pedobacter sp.]
MKALNLLTNTEKGRILIELFPEEKAPIIAAILERSQYLKEHEIKLRQQWADGFITFDFWYSLAIETEKVIHKYRYNLERSSKVFSDQLFYGHMAMFTNDCIVKYADNRTDHPKFQKMVSVLFG